MINFAFHPYRRRFRQPLKTHHGIWEIREGIILRLHDSQGNMGWGEIAPIPWFGSETLASALAFCNSLGNKITKEIILAIPATLPACQFAFESAWEDLYISPVQSQSGTIPNPVIIDYLRRQAKGKRQEAKERITKSAFNSEFGITYSYLIPTGQRALAAVKEYQNVTVFKWKIGVDSPKKEREIFQELVSVMPPGSCIRLDANGGLSLSEAEAWLNLCDRLDIVEFIEQPLPPTELQQMLSLSQAFLTPIALDESVANLSQLLACYEQGWRSIFVVKPAIAGSPSYLRSLCRKYKLDLVFSSVFETKVGKKAALRLAKQLSTNNRAVGFGVDDWFMEDENNIWQGFS